MVKNYIKLGLIFAVVSSFSSASFKSSIDEKGGFEFSKLGLDTGGFEIGNGREIVEVLNPDGAHSIKFYEDFDFELKGETTWATGILAKGAKAVLELGINRSSTIPTLSKFLIEGVKSNAGSIVSLAGLKGFRKDTYDEATGTYQVALSMHLAEGSALELLVESNLEGIKEIHAIADSVRVHIN